MKLIKYLPHEVRKIEEFEELCKVESPEFNQLDDIVKRVFDESFIESASEYGISRLERIANIIPNEFDTLEDRKFRLLVRYKFKLPYTEMVLIERLDVICGKGKYTLNIEHNRYIIEIDTRMKNKSQYDELLFLLEQMIPVNMLVLSSNTLSDSVINNIYFGTLIIESKNYTITNDILESYNINHTQSQGVGINQYKSEIIK